MRPLPLVFAIAALSACGPDPVPVAETGTETGTSSDSGVVADGADTDVVGRSPDDELSLDIDLADVDSGRLKDSAETEPEPRRIVILMIGDGMGRPQLEAASLYATGETGQLFMQTLPVQGSIATGSHSGITDSAASATAMATGVKTLNARVGVDREHAPVETLVETAQAYGLAGGVVTTASVPHATPAAFTAHHPSRHDYVEIAKDQALEVQPDVMLGGGAQFFGDLVVPLEAAGYSVVDTREALASVAATPVAGFFAAEHLDYVVDRPPNSPQPTLTEMSLKALELLDAASPGGFFLMIEGARIDMAGHLNDLERNVTETLAFDEAIEAVHGWIQSRPPDEAITLLVTADHECGGLRVDDAQPAGVLPEVSWRWLQHTNAHVDLFGLGPGAQLGGFDGALRDHTWVHAAARAALTGEPLLEPPVVITPDGHLADLPFEVGAQLNESGFGPGYNQLDALHLGADGYGLGVGVEGLFEWDKNAVVILVDVDFGAGSGLLPIAGGVTDDKGLVDSILAELLLDASSVPGFGPELALVAWGGQDPHLEDLWDEAGLRGLVDPHGEPEDLDWHGAAINFGEQVRARDTALAPTPGAGLETFLYWDTLYPDGLPAGATLAIAAVLVNDDGGYLSNQALPPFAAGTDNPGRTLTPIPGVAVFQPDSDLPPWISP